MLIEQIFELRGPGPLGVYYIFSDYAQSPIASGGWELRPQIPVCDTLELQ